MKLELGEFEVKMNRDTILFKLPKFDPEQPKSDLYIFYSRPLNIFETKYFPAETNLNLYKSSVLIINTQTTETTPDKFQLWTLNLPQLNFLNSESEESQIIPSLKPISQKVVTLKPFFIK